MFKIIPTLGAVSIAAVLIALELMFVPTLVPAASAPAPTFIDVAAEAGVDDPGLGTGVSFGDYDHDGYLDIYVANHFGSDVLYHNNGDGTFTDVAETAGISGMDDGWDVVFGDYNNDGALDIYVTNSGQASVLYRNNNDGTFANVTEVAGVGDNEGSGLGVALGDYENDGDLDIYVANFDDGANVLYRNNGDGTFTDFTASSGVGHMASSSGCTFGDYDDDGDLDLYVVNSGAADVLYRNNGDGTFSDVTIAAGVAGPGKGENAAFGDYDNDGDLDLYLVNYYQPNVLYRNNGDGTFTDVATAAGVGYVAASMSAIFGDYDNDGYLDLYVANLGGANILYRNNGDGTFADVTAVAGVGDEGASLGTAFGDYDHDGDLDLYVANSGQANVLYGNGGNANHWLHVKTIGTTSNRDGVGARVKVVAGELSQIRQVGGDSGRCMNSLLVEFGLGAYARADLVEIRWPSGMVQTFADVQADQVIIVQEGADSFSPGD
jgi:hypothetical protein